MAVHKYSLCLLCVGLLGNAFSFNRSCPRCTAYSIFSASLGCFCPIHFGPICAACGHAHEELLGFLSAVGAAADRAVPRSLQASAPSSSVTPANTSLPDLSATQAIAMLCARDVTSVEYVQALFDRYDTGGFECLNAFVSLNRTRVHDQYLPSSRKMCTANSPLTYHTVRLALAYLFSQLCCAICKLCGANWDVNNTSLACCMSKVQVVSWFQNPV